MDDKVERTTFQRQTWRDKGECCDEHMDGLGKVQTV